MNYRKNIGSQIFRLFISILLFFSFQINFYANAQTETIPNWISVRHSPFNLVDPPDITNPVITANDVTDVSAGLVADPFLFHEDEAWYMFFEVYNTISGKGEIGLAISSNGLNWNYQKIVLSETMHLSYPLILKSNGEYYMIPETYKWNQVRIYRANNFPYDWTYLTSIASGRKFVDPTIFQYDNKWWLFVSKPSNDILYLYYSDNLISGWTEHPMSPVIVSDASIARPGGRSFVFDNDRIIRIAQKCDVYYAQRVRAFEVDILDETQYAEHEIPESPILNESGTDWNAYGMHHFDPWWTGREWICAVDGGANRSIWSIGIYIAKPERDLSYTPVAPCRIVDTRKAGGAISAGGIRSYNVLGAVASQGGNSAGCPSPKGQPYSVHINVTSVPLGNGWITAYPYGSTAPTASIVNYRSDAQNVANSGTIKTCANCNKDITIKSGGGTTHVIIDVLGYYYSAP